VRQLNTRDTEGARAFYGAVLGWETDTFEMGEGEITLWRVPGYVGGDPEQHGTREVVGVMAWMSGVRFPADVTPHWIVNCLGRRRRRDRRPGGPAGRQSGGPALRRPGIQGGRPRRSPRRRVSVSG
jgi:catechol 2,3-dioxygenase-like lactoylglutathione lyase family enzyme